MNNKSHSGRNGGSGRTNFSTARLPNDGRNGASNSGAAELLPLFETVLRRWPWLVVGVIVPAVLGCVLGILLWKSSYTAPAQLIRYDSPNAEQVFGARQAAPETLPSILHSPELLQRVGAAAKPPVAPDVLLANLRVMPEHDSDIIVVTLTGHDPVSTVALVNEYAHQSVLFTQEMQSNAANDVIQFANQQIAKIESEIKATSSSAVPVTPIVASAAITPGNPGAVTPTAVDAAPEPNTAALLKKYEVAYDDLADLLARYTDAHPLVQAKRAEIAALEKEMLPLKTAGKTTAQSIARLTSESAASAAPAPYVPVEKDREVLISKIQSLESARLSLLGREQAAAALAAAPPGYCQLLAAATDKDLVKHGRKAKIFFLTAFLGLLGFVGAAGLILLIEVSDNRLKSAADVRRVAKLPLLDVMGDLDRMTASQRKNWAFRAWTSLQGRLSPSPNHGLVCGITSSDNGEGRSTWVKHIAEAANQLGFRVLTIATGPCEGTGGLLGNASPEAPRIEGVPADETAASNALATNVLASPAEVAEKLMSSDPQPVLHIPLPGWVWDLDRRKQWQEALHKWSQIENVVILVELPPAKQPEAVLLAHNLPNIVWMTGSGKADAAETREHLETLRFARCRLAGAILNRATTSIFQKRFCRWFSCAALFVLLGATTLRAQNTPAPAPNMIFSAYAPGQRAPWQRHFTLGPGDVLNFSLYNEPTLIETGVPIGPDGRVSFLEAQDIEATGLTVDELRGRIDEALSKYRRAPRSIITPVAFNSKKYFVLGSVARGGVFTLDRPVTVVEAVARARGMQTALQQRNLVEIANLRRAFLVRDGKRMTVDFEKLFKQGDLSQNVALAPNDYLYFPPADLNQVYVVGEVVTPGIAPCTDETSVLGALAEKGGFSKRAWKKRILVIRGSLDHPKTFVLDAGDMLSARAPDFKLEPDDIVYVHSRPWIRAEELLDLAASSFVQSAVIAWTDLHVGPRVAGAVVQ